MISLERLAVYAVVALFMAAVALGVVIGLGVHGAVSP